MSSDDSFFREDAPPRPVDPEGLIPKLPPDQWRPAPPPREDAIISSGTLPGTSEPATTVSRPAPPQPPHPNFGFAVLWCGAFVAVTQIVPITPALAIGLVVGIVDALRGNIDPGDSGAMLQKGTNAAVLAAVFFSQALGISFSLLILRLVAGRDWARQVGLRLPRAWQVIVLLLGFPALPVLANGAYLLAKRHLPGIPEAVPFYLTQLVVIPLAWLAVRRIAGPGWNERLIRQPIVAQVGLVSAVVLAALLIGVGVYQLISPPVMKVLRIPFEGQLMEMAVEQFRSWPWAVAVLIIGFGPGLSEELWCRAYLGRGLVGHYGVVLGVVLSSYLFGLIHLEPHQATMAALLGLVLHAAYLLTRSLLAPMLLHALNNALTVAGDKLGPEWEKLDNSPQDIPVSLYLASVVLMLAVGWALYQGRSRLASVGKGQPPWQPVFPGPAYPPEGSNTVVVRPWPGWIATGLVIAAAALFGAVIYLLETKQLSW